MDYNNFINKLKVITGSNYVITEKWLKESYSKGWRYGEGDALAVVKPETLLEFWKILKVCVKFDVIILQLLIQTMYVVILGKKH